MIGTLLLIPGTIVATGMTQLHLEQSFSGPNRDPSFLWRIIQAASTHIMVLTAKLQEKEALYYQLSANSEAILEKSRQFQREVQERWGVG